MKKLLSIILTAIMGLSLFSYNVMAQENLMPNYEVVDGIATITVPADTDESLIKEQVQYLFDHSDYETICVDYEYPQTRATNGKHENKKTFYYLSIVYFTTIKATGEVYNNVYVRDFKVTVTTSGFPVVHDSTMYANRSNTACYATVKVTLSGAIPHTYTYRAPLLSEIYLYAG